MTAHAATGAERERLWARWRETDENLDAFAARRPSETAVVVLEPAGAVPGTLPATDRAGVVHPLGVMPRGSGRASMAPWSRSRWPRAGRRGSPGAASGRS